MGCLEEFIIKLLLHHLPTQQFTLTFSLHPFTLNLGHIQSRMSCLILKIYLNFYQPFINLMKKIK